MRVWLVWISAGLKTHNLPMPTEQAENTIATHFSASFHVADNVGTERKREAVALRSNGHNTNVTVQIAIATYSRLKIMHSFQIELFFSS